MIRLFLILAVLVAVTYVSFARWKKGKNLESVSSIAYILPTWLFTTTLGIEGILLSPGMFEIMPENWKFISFLSVCGLFLVAASPRFHSESTVIHCVGGYMFCFFGQIIVAFVSPIALLGWSPFAMYLLFSKKSDKTFWAEATSIS